ncbi:hypothetical protein DOTSEDRAFT_156872 [Dothistroma septosporum NZE10]|uniref:Uncharacterized protein n=1 Tax=Dothistroma septosporum (strain NZE10 / CBS 128990) TaxID=675120 RepID=N1PJS6_DOTSN|nr:hypothetical protein DOTSEDRAFT_156872 [Dothistroma septosporum NZE10]
MARHTQIWRYTLLFLTFLSVALAATPTSFCKCTCFTNSTIIPLNGPSSSLKNNTFFSDPSPPNLKPRNDEPLFAARAPAESTKRTCNDCNKQFCLSYNLPICKDADAEKDVFATCFQRDSTKDEIVVLVFIGATVGLLAWAMVKPWWERWREGSGYARVGG